MAALPPRRAAPAPGLPALRRDFLRVVNVTPLPADRDAADRLRRAAVSQALPAPTDAADGPTRHIETDAPKD